MSNFPQTPPLMSLPYAQRQLVVLQPDDVVNVARGAGGKNATISDVASIAANAAGYLLGGYFWGNAAATLIKDAIAAYQKATASGLNVMPISIEEASQLHFPPGHPRLGTLYAAHPAKSTVYYTASMFHRAAFEHKFGEAVNLLMSLGAADIEVKHVQGWSREFSATISSPIPSAPVDASISTNGSQASSLLFQAEFDNPTEPHLPPELFWYAHEPTWSNVADGRLKFGMKKFSLTVAYQDDYGVNASLKAKVEKSGLNMGGSFAAHTETTWIVSGKFNPRTLRPA